MEADTTTGGSSALGSASCPAATMKSIDTSTDGAMADCEKGPRRTNEKGSGAATRANTRGRNHLDGQWLFAQGPLWPGV